MTLVPSLQKPPFGATPPAIKEIKRLGGRGLTRERNLSDPGAFGGNLGGDSYSGL